MANEHVINTVAVVGSIEGGGVRFMASLYSVVADNNRLVLM